MIGFFPDPYPDELLYSACARYSHRTKYLNKQSAVIESFGRRGLSAIWDFPNRLNYLLSVLPEGHSYSDEQLINENTLLPYHEPFLPSERSYLVREEMKGEDDNKIHARLGTRIKQIESPKYLRYCSDCVNEDREKYGENYWHRIHQLAGILVCPIHKCFLKNSPVELGRMSSKYFHDAESFLPIKVSKSLKLDFQNSTHKILYKTACDAEWLLSKGNIPIGSEIIQARYFNTLLKKGYAYYNGRLKYTKLLADVKNFFPPEIFNSIGRVSNKEDWIGVLTRIGNIDITYHPIRHLLLLTFLGMSAEEFFDDFQEYKPFEDPPYPCLNLASNHYKELLIKECKVFDNISKEVEKQGIPLGVFSCECGFIYQRLGPDKSEKDKYSYSKVREYGKIWEDEFKDLWETLSFSLTAIGERLGISSTSVGRQAIRLDMPMNNENTRVLQGYDRHRNPKKSFSEMRAKYRADWLKLRAENPGLTRHQLVDEGNFLYLWLNREDRAWFQKHLPKQVTARKKTEVLNWKQIDENLAEKVESVCKEILSSKNFPVRICISEIIRRIGNKTWLEKRDKKLPHTTKVIEKYHETLEDYMLKKIKWTTERFIEDKELPTIHQFKRRAVVRNKTSENSIKIQQAIKAALIEIEKSLNSL